MMVLTVIPLQSLLAQASPVDAVLGSAGWAGAGLLGLVLMWLLFKHLPAKDAQMEKILTQKDELLLKLLADKDAQIASDKVSYESRMTQAQASWEKSLDTVCRSNRTDIEYLAKTLEREANAFNSGADRIAEELRRISIEAPKTTSRPTRPEKAAS